MSAYLSISNRASDNLKIYAEQYPQAQTQEIIEFQKFIKKKYFPLKKGLCLAAIITVIATSILLAAKVSILSGVLVGAVVFIPLSICLIFLRQEKKLKNELERKASILNGIFQKMVSFINIEYRAKEVYVIEQLTNNKLSESQPLKEVRTKIAEIAESYDQNKFGKINGFSEFINNVINNDMKPAFLKKKIWVSFKNACMRFRQGSYNNTSPALSYHLYSHYYINIQKLNGAYIGCSWENKNRKRKRDIK